MIKIFYKYSKCETLTLTKGDFINEINNMKALSKFAEVYYNGFYFDAENLLFIFNKTVQLKDCDFVYSRANETLIREAVKYGIPCCYMASPYNEYCFDNANFIAAFTKKWKQNLNEGVVNALNPQGKIYNNVECIEQTISDNFKPMQHDAKTKTIHNKINSDFVIGHFGRIVKSNYPNLIIDAMPEVIKKYPQIRFLFGCTNQGVLPTHKNIVYTNFSYDDMPFALSACDFTMTCAKGIEWDFCGSLKIMESAACGVPFICAESTARKDFVWDNYPLFLPMECMEEPITPEKIEKFITVLDFAYKIKGYLKNELMIRAMEYKENKQSGRLEKIITKYLK